MPPRGQHRSLSSQDKVRQTIVETLEAPRLTGIKTEDFVKFAQKREIYERQVQEKSQEQGIQIPTTTLRNSIDRPILNILITAQWVSVSSIDDLTEEHLQKCVSERSEVKPEDYDLAQIERDLSSVKMDQGSGSLEMKIWNLGLQYATKLEELGYSSFIEAQPKIAIGHILQRITHLKLFKRMKLTFRLKKDEMKADYNNFMRETAKEARALDRHEAASNFAEIDYDSDIVETPKGTQGSKQHRSKKLKKNKGNTDKKSTDSAGNKRSLDDTSRDRDRKKRRPDCLNPKCDKKHFLRDCEITSAEESKKLMDEYFRKKRESKKDGSIGQVQAFDDDINADLNSSLFSASFCDGCVHTTVLADQGSDECILPPQVLSQIGKVRSDLDVVTLDRPCHYETVDKSAKSLTCSRVVTLNILTKIRHGTELSLRGIKWYVSDTPVGHCIISRHVLSALGLNNRILLEAACHRHNGIVDVPTVLKQDPTNQTKAEANGRSIHSLLNRKFMEFGSSFHDQANAIQDTPTDEDIYIDLGEDSDDDLRAALRCRLDEAKANGLSTQGCGKLAILMNQYKRVFRIRLGASPPASVPPMKIRLRPSNNPVRVKARRYSSEQRQFMERYAQKLLDMEFAFVMPTASWQAAPLIVPKPGSRSKYRMAIDLRPVNAATIKESWPMPHLESEMLDFVGSTCFASLDFVSAYWQLPLHPTSYSLCGIVTPRVVLASKRVLPGLANATSYFQSTVEPLFAELRTNLKAWLDDFNLHAHSESELLHFLDRFFSICDQHGLFLSAVKSTFFSQSIRWCGRLISSDGYQLDPSRLTGLCNMHEPQTANELCEFVHCCRWMSLSIPDFSRTVAPLTGLLETAYRISGKRTKRSLRKISLRTLSWGATHSDAFNSLQKTLRNAVKLSYVDPNKEICIYTDASECFWSAVVTQTSKQDLELPIGEQRHQPLAFLGAEFKGSQLGWTTFEKEAFAIFQTFEKLDYMLMSSKPVHVYTDHRNLLFVFDPLSLEPALGRHIISKVQRWALYLSRFSYVIEHVSGSSNVFADILTRWTRGYRHPSQELKSICTIVVRNEQMVRAADSIVWPTIEVIRDSQQAAQNPREDSSLDTEDNIRKLNGCIWIPVNDVNLQMKLIVSSHCGVMGHRGKDATLSTLRENFYWKTMEKDVSVFIKECIHCIMTRSGKMVPRPLAHALHGENPNDVIHMDFLYMGPSTEQKRYLLLLKDDHSSVVWLWPTDACTSEEAASALIHWIGSFGSIKWLVSDQGSHFKNSLVQELSRELRINHHFTTPYSPWANGTVERICKEVLRSTTALLSEWKLGPRDWPAVTECVQSVLNHSPLKRLGLRKRSTPNVFRTPLEVFTGHIPLRPLLRAMPFEQYKRAHSLDEVRLQQILHIDELQHAMENMHREVATRSNHSRRRSVEAHNRKTNLQPINFSTGDFVLVRRPTSKGHKLQFKWMGPRRVLQATSNQVFEVEDLITGKKEVVHARRLQLYRSDMEGKPVDPELTKHIQHLEAIYQDALKFVGIRLQNDIIDVQVEWVGLPDEVDYTWEPLKQVHEDIPELLFKFLSSPGQPRLKAQAKAQCNNYTHSLG